MNNLRKRLEQMRISEARNAERIQAYLDDQNSDAIHRLIEAKARDMLAQLDRVASYYDVKRGNLLEMLVDTLWAEQQATEQEVK